MKLEARGPGGSLAVLRMVSPDQTIKLGPESTMGRYQDLAAIEEVSCAILKGANDLAALKQLFETAGFETELSEEP